mmetsp:Transcript_49131/g.97963  ORF Transcript_49131/g.97963 Transcript_49131/m.97963 type:complete len:136 (+) Transcript_49131:127-534(+)
MNLSTSVHAMVHVLGMLWYSSPHTNEHSNSYTSQSSHAASCDHVCHALMQLNRLTPICISNGHLHQSRKIAQCSSGRSAARSSGSSGKSPMRDLSTECNLAAAVHAHLSYVCTSTTLRVPIASKSLHRICAIPIT